MSERYPCKKCGKMALPITLKVTEGLCMPCCRQQERETEEQRQLLLRQQAITIHETKAETRFFTECAAFCQLDCCGFDALEITPERFRTAATACGVSIATEALSSVESHIREIGQHRGLVVTFGRHEQADKATKNYALCAFLIREALDA